MKNAQLRPKNHHILLYTDIANNLSVDLFDYVNNKLETNLVLYINRPKDKYKLEYWLNNSSKTNLREIMENYDIAFRKFKAQTYTEIIYNTNTSQRRKDFNIDLNVNRAREHLSEKSKKWADELEAIWEELNTEEGEDV